jgi:hypothetical protein
MFRRSSDISATANPPKITSSTATAGTMLP